MARVLQLFILSYLLYAHCEFLDEFEPMGFDDSFITAGFLDDQNDGMSIMNDMDIASPLIESIDQMVDSKGLGKPKKSKVQNFYAKKKISPGKSEMVMGTDLDETKEYTFDSEVPVKRERKSKKSKSSKGWKKFKKMFRKKKSKSKKESRLAKAVKIAKAEKKSKEKAKKLQKAIQKKPKRVVYELEPEDYLLEEIPIVKSFTRQRPIITQLFDRPVQKIGYPMEVEIQLRKENSNPTKGFVRTVKYVDGKPIVKEKQINSMTMDIVPPSMPIIFDPYTSLIETSDGQKKLMESLDQMFAMKGFSTSNSNPSSGSTKNAKKNFIPCDMRRTCEECTVDFSCYYCSSKKQCFPARYFGADSFTGSHCPASDIYYFETCKVKSFVFMFFLIIFCLCLLFAVVVMGFSLIYRRTRRAKIYNIIKEKDDEIDSNGKPHPLVE